MSAWLLKTETRPLGPPHRFILAKLRSGILRIRMGEGANLIRPHYSVFRYK